MIESHSDAELKEIFEQDVRLLQDKEAFMRGDKNHKYSRAAIFHIEAWEQERKMMPIHDTLFHEIGIWTMRND